MIVVFSLRCNATAFFFYSGIQHALYIFWKYTDQLVDKKYAKRDILLLGSTSLNACFFQIHFKIHCAINRRRTCLLISVNFCRTCNCLDPFSVTVLLFSSAIRLGILRDPFFFLQSLCALVLQGQQVNEALRLVEQGKNCSEG